MMKHKFRLTLLFSLFICGTTMLQAATWLSSASKDWFYVDAYLKEYFFESSADLNASELIHAQSFPLNALDHLEQFYPKIIPTEDHIELWIYGKTDSFKIKNSTTEGLMFFNENLDLCFYRARSIKYFLKEFSDGSIELWDAINNERIIELAEHAVEQFRRKEDVIVLTLVSED